MDEEKEVKSEYEQLELDTRPALLQAITAVTMDAVETAHEMTIRRPRFAAHPGSRGRLFIFWCVHIGRYAQQIPHGTHEAPESLDEEAAYQKLLKEYHVI